MNASPSPSRHWAELALVIMCVFTFASEIQRRYDARPARDGVGLEWGGWLGGDGMAYRATVKGIWERGSINPFETFPEPGKYDEVPGRNVHNFDSNVTVTVDGRFFPKASLLMPLMSLPFYVLFREHGLLIFNIINCILLILLVFYYCRLFVSELAALVGATAFLADGIVRYYSYNYSSDVFVGVLLFGGLVLLWRPHGSPRLYALGGVLIGLTTFTRPVHLAYGAALFPLMLEAWRARSLTARLKWAALGCGLTTGTNLLLNTLLFGAPLSYCYEHMLVVKNGVRVVESQLIKYNLPFWGSLYKKFFHQGEGVFMTFPHFPLFLVSMWPLWRLRRVEAVTLFLMVWVPILSLVKFDSWGSSGYGNRFYICPAALGALGLAWLAEVAIGRKWMCLRTAPSMEPPPPVSPTVGEAG